MLMVQMQKTTSTLSPQKTARLAGFFWLMTIIMGVLELLRLGRGVSLLAVVSYIGATLAIYKLLRNINPTIAVIATFSSLVGCSLGILKLFNLDPFHINTLAFFGVHCIGVGYLVLRSTFLPSFIGILMILGGLSWLTFGSAELSKLLTPYNMIPGILGELTLTLWLLIAGINLKRMAGIEPIPG
jgi:hypothetical protein